ncbi:3320_t:CDS:2 [Gigaspora margarita]|uniref:3320_t:CDS:1 n=1 Tax=Gigaspora margarita TaxID=4874 RepID=A0ABN7V2G6_GIGMA|nr:3320_t:CDS:2 [Gigaspora margarita]
MKLIKQLDIILLLLWCILSFNFIENINSGPISSSLPLSCLSSIEGPVIYRNDTLFPSLIIDQNIRVNYTPTVLVYAIDDKDVQKAVKCAVKLGRDIVPRSGGHSYEKYGLGGRNNVIVLDLTFVNGITINSETETAKIGAGNRLGNVYNQLNQAGFLIPAGLCPSVGIGGHALGGGFGYYSRKYGLACDNIISMEMVNATGDILHVDSNTISDLYFALRGAGGGSYGIVTYFVFRIHRTPPQVTYMEMAFNKANMNQVYQVFDAFNKIGPSLDDRIALKMRMNKSSLSINGLYLGPCTEARNAMKGFIDASNPIPTSKKFIPQTFFESVETLSKIPNKYDVVNPKHNPNFFKAKSFVVNKGKGLTRQAIKVLNEFLTKDTSCKTLASFDLFGGAANVKDSSSSFIHRDALYCIQMESDWETKEQNTECTSEINKFGRTFQLFINSNESYQDFIDRDLDHWQKKYYGEKNFEKLVNIKKKYDPDNLFNFPQSIPVKIRKF